MSDKDGLNLEELRSGTALPAAPDVDRFDHPESRLHGATELEAVYDIPVQMSAVLGKATMQVSQLLKLGRGAVVELDRKVGGAIDISVRSEERRVGKGWGGTG